MMDSREFVDKLFDGIAARVDQFFKAKNIQGGVRCGDDMFSMMDKAQLRQSLDQFRAEALKEAATNARNAILDFGKGDTVSSWHSPMIRKEMAAQLAERAILGETKWE